MLDVFKVSFGFSTYGGAKSRKYKRQLPVATCGVKILKRYNRCLPVAIYSAEKLKKYKDLYFLAEKTRYIATEAWVLVFSQQKNHLYCNWKSLFVFF